MAWVDDIVKALKNRDGIAHRSDLIEDLKEIRPKPLPDSFVQSFQASIQRYSSDSESFTGKEEDDYFYSVDGIGSGVWGLREYLKNTPKASDIEDSDLPPRVKSEVYRILRDTELSRKLKKMYKDKCQICGETIELRGKKTYSEAHHIKPLGGEHRGPDSIGNILVLCPNHHVLCDYGAIKLNPEELKLSPDHKLDQEMINYHNEVIYNSA